MKRRHALLGTLGACIGLSAPRASDAQGGGKAPRYWIARWRRAAERRRIAELALKHKLPIMSSGSELVDAGGLLSYGPNYVDLFRRAPVYIDKILKGAKPGELPIEEPTKFDLVINLRTAKLIGVQIPQALLVRASRVID